MEGLNLKATAKVTLTKLDENGKVIGVEQREIDLTKEEASELWRSLQQE
jgi:hypothetical protein